MSIPGYKFTMPLRVRWAEVDRQGVVFNGQYLTYFDVGITEYWRAIGLPYPAGIADTGTDLYVVKALVNYHAPVEYDDMLELGVRVERMGNSSLTFAIQIDRDGKCLTTGEVVYVTTHLVSRKSCPIPQKLRVGIEAFEHPDNLGNASPLRSSRQTKPSTRSALP
jgi:acyl-CoA thioester hydrolase